MRSTGFALVVAIAAGLACAGTTEPPAPHEVVAEALPAEAPAEAQGNVAACKGYLEYARKAPCTAHVEVADSVCGSYLDHMPCDLSPYFRCMAEHHRCDGASADLSGQVACGSPTCPL
jgi:hypothetical protein